MKAIEPSERQVRNIADAAAFRPFVWEGREEGGTSVLQLDDSRPDGSGFHVYKMAPGAITTPHEHTSDEHFYVIEGDIVDHDGYEYRAGDLVLLKQGTRHNSRTRNGCVLVVYIETAEVSA